MCDSFIQRKKCVTLYYSGLLFNVNYKNWARSNTTNLRNAYLSHFYRISGIKTIAKSDQ